MLFPRAYFPLSFFSPLALAVPLLGLTACALASPDGTAGTLLPPTTQPQRSALMQMQDAFTNIAQTVEPTVVNIKSVRLRSEDSESDGEDGDTPGSKHSPTPGTPLSPAEPLPSEATGSGVIVRADGYILTNDHVVDGAEGGVVTVTLFDGREFSGKVFPDYKSDLAVVKIDPGPVSLPVAGFAGDDSVRPGQWAVAIGSPFDLQNTMTVGVISAIGRHQRIGGESSSSPARYYPNLIQTDAAINPGNSGGPLFNIDGKVVGINVAIESPVEGSAGVGFAIPSGIAQQVMNSLIRSGKVVRGYLGIAPEDLTPALQTKYGQKDGAFVRDVKLDSPAGNAGIQAGDIITTYDGLPMHGEVSLRESISLTQPGKTITLAYVRDGRPGTAAVTLGTAPALPMELSVVKPASSTIRLGLSVRTLLPQDRLALGLPPTVTGVLITDLDPSSPAKRAEISSEFSLTGTVLQKLDGQSVTTKAEYAQAAARLTPGSAVTFVVLYSADGQLHQTVVSVQL
jgi:serine protease Do